jgi:hypothetical protein
MTGLKGLVVAAAAALGALFAIGCVAVPVVLWRALLPESAPAWALAAVPAVVSVVLILGLSLR